MVGIICNDAGGASIIASYIVNHPSNYLFHITGPAVKVFQRIYGQFTQIDLNEMFSCINLLYVGTSVQTDIEYSAIVQAKSLKIKVIAFIDHWTLYEDRFIRNNKMVIPDEFIVTDDLAKKLISKFFPRAVVKKINNPYIALLKKEYQLLKQKNPKPTIKQALWLSDPFDDLDYPFSEQSNRNSKLNFSELEALEWFAINVREKFPEVEHLIIRPHPSEEKNKFDEKYRNLCLDVKISDNENLLVDIVQSNVIGGVGTMALYIAFKLGAPAFRSIPDTGFESIGGFSLIKRI